MLSTRRRAFTHFDLLAVIASIPLLIGLLLPATQKAREAAARTRCANNIKLIAQAYHKLHDARNGFPAVMSKAPVRTGGMVFALPYIEQEKLYRQYDFTANWFDVVNRPVYQKQIPLLHCPAAPQNLTHAGTQDGVEVAAAAVSDYVTTHGVGNRSGNAPYPAGTDLSGAVKGGATDGWRN